MRSLLGNTNWLKRSLVCGATWSTARTQIGSCRYYSYIYRSTALAQYWFAGPADDRRRMSGMTTAEEESSRVCPKTLFQFIQDKVGIQFFTGVPDSCIKTFCNVIDESCASTTDGNADDRPTAIHAIAANEGSSVALAVGNYLATGRIPLVYMQNSGLGNAANPILSAAHNEVYSIPMILVLGWRGAPDTYDEPQHLVTGRKTKLLLEAMDVETFVLPKGDLQAAQTFQQAHDTAKERNSPVAILVPPNTFSGNVPKPPRDTSRDMVREEALGFILDAIGPNDAVVATTGFTSREVYELREAHGESHSSDFLCVGSMGHAIAIAQGVALSQPNRKVWCIDGDGAALMHMGSMAFSSSFNLSNLRHVLINNDAHESVGGQKTAASQAHFDPSTSNLLSFTSLATSMGYQSVGTSTSRSDVVEKLGLIKIGSNSRPSFLEIRVSTGTRSDLGRPKTSTRDSRNAFMGFCQTPLPDAGLQSSSGFTESGDPLLLTPGPLTTSQSVKEAMLHDLGSRDQSFIKLTQRVRKQLVEVLSHASSSNDLTAVLLQGSGTFAVEAMIGQFVPPETGKLLILVNGAYGRRMGSICDALDRRYAIAESSETEPLSMEAVRKALEDHPDATHVAVVSCETTTGVWNPVQDIALAVADHSKSLLIDAMSSFGVMDIPADLPFDAMAASSNKGLQGSPGLGFVLAREAALERSNGNARTLALDLYQQWKGFEKSGEWRFTPPTHCLLALAQALDEFEAEGGATARKKRYQANCDVLVSGMRKRGFQTILGSEVQTPVIVTFQMPTHESFVFRDFYDRLAERGYVIYPGKLTAAPTFRVGCIGHMVARDMDGFLLAVDAVLSEMQVSLHV